jgi:mono/diheme cytochrome c family protein
MGDARLDRGAYLVEALTHCGWCHTPRSKLTFAEKAYDFRSPAFLTELLSAAGRPQICVPATAPRKAGAMINSPRS